MFVILYFNPPIHPCINNAKFSIFTYRYIPLFHLLHITLFVSTGHLYNNVMVRHTEVFINLSWYYTS
jgi:hypothetical protein